MIDRRRFARPVALAATLVAALAVAPPASGQDRDAAALAAFAQGGRVLLIRHAEAPGVGDPPGFRLDDCTTQRNLDERGRAQARRIGERLRAAGVKDVVVLTSRWCRARDTAALLALGPVEDFEPLDSFFAAADRAQPSTEALARAIADLPLDGAPVVMVTHQVNITALTRVVPASGEAVILRLDGSASPPIEARVTTPP